MGTLIYSCTSDPLKCLSLALHDGSCTDTPFNLDVSQSQLTTDRQKKVLREAGDIINGIVHDTIRDQKQKKIDLTTFDLRECIGSTSEVLWDFISSCTRSVRERTGRPYSSDSHIRNVRRLFIICQLLFSTNPSCATTLHHLVADTIEVNGGSRKLIRVLNRLGVSVASDTHDRLVTEVAEKEQSKSLWCELSPSTFTVASTDNIDFLQSHAAVYCGDQSRSYHATTAQVVQPVPSLTCKGEKAGTGTAHGPTHGPTTEHVPMLTAAHDPTHGPTHEHVPLLTGTGTAHDGPTAVASQHVPLVTGTGTTHGTPHGTLKTPLHKRLSSKSPSNSPHKHGKVGPKRRRTMEILPKQNNEARHEIACTNSYQQYRSLQLSKFLESGDSKCKLFKEAFAYLLKKHCYTMQDTETLKPLREFILPTSAQLSDHNPSLIYYMEILDENADSQSTMTQVSELLLEKLLVQSQKWVVLVGDGKTYDHLRKVKRSYELTFEKLLIFPGDWHLLKNYQPVLMKAYYHAGLREIAKNSGYKAETLKSLENCSHFKRTLLQLWEAMLIEMISLFVDSYPQFDALRSAILKAFEEAKQNDTTSHDLLITVQHLVTKTKALDEFNKFITKQGEADDTWQFWSNFVLTDCFGYVCLFIAIRTSNWDLRVSSLKNMIPLFSAYDRPCYQKLIPDHIADIECYDQQVLTCFREGGFTVKINGGMGHAVALDEAHEMCVNRDLKMAIARPTEAYLRKTNFFLSYRIKAQAQLTSQLFPDSAEPAQQSNLFDTTSHTKRWDTNIATMRSVMSKHKMFTSPESNRGIVNVFTGQEATPEQRHDLLNARKLGTQHYENYITHHILQVPSVAKAPLRKRRLLTMAPPKITETKISQKQKEERDTNKYLRRRLAWCNRTGQQFDEGEEQYSLFPRALADPDGNPHKGVKSKWTAKLQARYNVPNTTPFTSSPPWIPQVAIVDAMFAINTNPLRQHKTMEQYAYFLFRQSVVPHFSRGTQEVHLVFDHPGRLPFNPKDCEHNRRYSKSSGSEHTHVILTTQSAVPRPWREHLECRQCKRAIVEALGWVFLHTGKNHLQGNQTLVLAGCFSGATQDDAWIITGGGTLPHSTERFRSNAQEADMRVWRHATQTQHQHVLVYSPDTDVYNVNYKALCGSN